MHSEYESYYSKAKPEKLSLFLGGKLYMGVSGLNFFISEFKVKIYDGIRI